MAPLTPTDLRVRSAIYDTLARTATSPSATELAGGVEISPDSVRQSLERLAANHVIVLRPGTDDVWMAMPFSAVPTPFRVESEPANNTAAAAWWGNCAWDALGIAAAIRGAQSTQRGTTFRVTTSCPDCEAPLTVRLVPGRDAADLVGTSDPPQPVVHFAVSARHWWDDVGYT